MEKNVRFKALVAIFLTMVVLLAACRTKDLSPRPINPEVDTCAVCNMSIIHEEYAAQAALTNGDKLIFDDLGCLVQYVIDLHEKELGASYVKEYGTDEWIQTDSAYYVYSKDFWTPMSYGVLAFSSKNKAEQFILQEGKGELMTPEDLLEHRWGIHSHE